MKILVCDDEIDIVSALKIYLMSEGYEVVEAYDGAKAVEKVANEDVSLVLLDIMMPVMDGIEAASKIREISNVPIIFLSAKSEDTDKVLGLNIGGDDYVTKPFNPVELMARVKSHLRRYTRLGGSLAVEVDNNFTIGPISIDDSAKKVYVDGEKISLTPTEYDILLFLVKQPGKVFSPKEIYEGVWKDDALGTENIIAVHIRHLREKIEINPAEPRYLKVVWGRGYMIEDIS